MACAKPVGTIPRQLDGSRFGSLPHGQSYQLVPIHRKAEGTFFMMFFNGKAPSPLTQ